MAKFRNWGGTASCSPARIVDVSSEDQLAATIKESGGSVKVVGTGHSFTDIACTDGVMIRLGGYDKVLGVDRAAKTITVQGGITIAALSDRLAEHGLAMSSLGDIGYQTITGAIATATHGTGLRYGNISSQVVALTIVTGEGSVVSCSEEKDPETFRAAQVSLGALGAISTVTIQCEDAFTLHAVEQPMRLGTLLGQMDTLAESNEHFEFFWFPHTDRAITKRNNRVTTMPRRKSRAKAWFDERLMANGVYGLVCKTGKAIPSLTRPLAKVVGAALSKAEYSDRSDRVFTSERRVRFAEMEYSIPREAAREAIEGIRRIIDDRGYRVSFPVEVRFVAPDDMFLSPANGRVSCFVAVHMYRGLAYELYFRDVEALMNGLGGRPHWGKLHFQTAGTLSQRYPDWERFAAVRKRLDPNGVFANGYTKRVLG